MYDRFVAKTTDVQSSCCEDLVNIKYIYLFFIPDIFSIEAHKSNTCKIVYDSVYACDLSRVSVKKRNYAVHYAVLSCWSVFIYYIIVAKLLVVFKPNIIELSERASILPFQDVNMQ